MWKHKEVSAAQKRAPPSVLAAWSWTFNSQNCKECTTVYESLSVWYFVTSAHGLRPKHCSQFVLFIDLFMLTVFVFTCHRKHISNLPKRSLLRYYVRGRNLDDFFIWLASYHKTNYDIIDPFPADLKYCSFSYTNGCTKLCLSLELQFRPTLPTLFIYVMGLCLIYLFN